MCVKYGFLRACQLALFCLLAYSSLWVSFGGSERKVSTFLSEFLWYPPIYCLGVFITVTVEIKIEGESLWRVYLADLTSEDDRCPRDMSVQTIIMVPISITTL